VVFGLSAGIMPEAPGGPCRVHIEVSEFDIPGHLRGHREESATILATPFWRTGRAAYSIKAPNTAGNPTLKHEGEKGMDRGEPDEAKAAPGKAGERSASLAFPSMRRGAGRHVFGVNSPPASGLLVE
jgi:hypothetical protein